MLSLIHFLSTIYYLLFNIHCFIQHSLVYTIKNSLLYMVLDNLLNVRILIYFQTLK